MNAVLGYPIISRISKNLDFLWAYHLFMILLALVSFLTEGMLDFTILKWDQLV